MAREVGDIRGRVFVVAGPSGAGKTTLLKELLRRNENFHYARSATTRPPRGGDENYLFLSVEEFTRRVRAGEFIEWAEVHGNYYGTLRSEVYDPAAEGRVVIADVDAKDGFPKLLELIPGSIGVGILPSHDQESCLSILEARMCARGDQSESVARRMLAVMNEFECVTAHAEFILVNPDGGFDDMLHAAESIISAYSHLNRNRKNHP
jgi:guanylate kinase